MLVLPGRDRTDAVALIRLWETEGMRAQFPAVLRLKGAFPFDAEVYHQLSSEPADRHPAICRACGCSHWDPCDDPDHGGSCGWSEPDLCTHCSDPDHDQDLRGFREVDL